MLIGYARVSTIDQNLDLQQDALKKAGCGRIFTDKASGIKTDRQGLDDAINFAREGDTIVVWRLDRLGRSIKHLLEVVKELEDKGIGFTSIQENINTSTSGGRLIFIIFGALAEFELNIIRERTLAGLAAARTRGKRGGRPPALNRNQIEALKTLFANKTNTIDELCGLFEISRTTLYKLTRN